MAVKFIDEVEVEVIAGKGGDGCVAFRREKYRPFGGPCGGDGGKGGDIILIGDRNISTLLEFHYRPCWRGRRGENGKGKDMFGKSAPPTIIKVPVGTIVKDAETGELLADIKEHGQRFIAARGGRGGKGNLSLKTARNKAPDYAERGQEGERRRLFLSLHLVADVGIAGFPNVGKSTFIKRISSANPKIADYPFTTLVPNLGIARLDELRSFVVADIPGIIEGASEGVGLGVRFLKHVERTKCILHMLTFDLYQGRNPLRDYEILNREFKKYSPEVGEKPQIVVLNKIDMPEVRQRASKIAAEFERIGIELVMISALTGEGVKELVEKVWKMLERAET